MAAKKKQLTNDQLRDMLWEIAQSIDWKVDDISALTDHPDFDEFENAMQKRGPKLYTVPAFEISGPDIIKIINEVQDSCLDNKTKENIKKAVKNAKGK